MTLAPIHGAPNANDNAYGLLCREIIEQEVFETKNVIHQKRKSINKKVVLIRT